MLFRSVTAPGPFATYRSWRDAADDAVRFLTTSVLGLPTDLAGEIHAGAKKIVGDSRTEIDVVPDDDPAGQPARDDLAARYRWKFAGVWFDRAAKVYLRPYAVVTGWGEEDTRPTRVAGRVVENRYRPRPSASMVSRSAGGDPEAWGDFRCVYYMNDRVHDRVIQMDVPGGGRETYGHNTAVLWEPVAAPPFWWPLPKTPDLAMAAYLAEGFHLEERGAHVEAARERAAKKRAEETLAAAGIEPPPPPVQPPPADPRPVPTPTADLLRELMPAETPQHVREGIMRSFDETEETPKPRRVTDPAEAAYAWVARDGTYWTCRGFMDHKASAHGVAEALGMSLARWKDNAEHALGEMGWAKVGRTAENEPFAWIDATKTPTDAQFDAVAKWLIHYKADPLDIQTWADSRKRPE